MFFSSCFYNEWFRCLLFTPKRFLWVFCKCHISGKCLGQMLEKHMLAEECNVQSRLYCFLKLWENVRPVTRVSGQCQKSHLIIFYSPCKLWQLNNLEWINTWKTNYNIFINFSLWHVALLSFWMNLDCNKIARSLCQAATVILAYE
jgi:hypothetical protein